MDTIGTRIQAARLANDQMSRAALASRLGRTERTVYRWENDENPVPSDMLQRIAEITGKTVAWFFEGAAA